MSDVVRRLMGQQRRRLVASMLTSSENTSWWGKLSTREQAEFKSTLIGNIGIYHDFMLDVVQVGGEGELRSEQAVTILQEIRAGVSAMQREQRPKAVSSG